MVNSVSCEGMEERGKEERGREEKRGRGGRGREGGRDCMVVVCKERTSCSLPGEVWEGGESEEEKHLAGGVQGR